MAGRNFRSLYSKVFFVSIFIAIVLILFLIIRPFIPAILSGAIIGYLFYPLYKKFQKRIRNENIRAVLVSILLVLIVTIPVVISLSALAGEARQTYKSIDQHRVGSNFMEFVCENEGNLLCRTLTSFLSFLPEQNLNFYLRSTLEKITAIIIQNISKFLIAVPAFILNVFIVLFVVFYVLRDGKKFMSKLSNALPLDQKQKNHVMRKFDQITHGVFIGNLAVAGIQGLLGGIGFFLLGISSPILWGFMMALFALVPYFGTAIIWLPAALNLIIVGNLTSNNSSIIKGIILILYGVIIVSSIDNILKPKIIGSSAQVHPLLVLIGVLGGINLFGIMGVVLGPILLSLLLVLIGIYEDELLNSS